MYVHKEVPILSLVMQCCESCQALNHWRGEEERGRRDGGILAI